MAAVAVRSAVTPRRRRAKKVITAAALTAVQTLKLCSALKPLATPSGDLTLCLKAGKPTGAGVLPVAVLGSRCSEECKSGAALSASNLTHVYEMVQVVLPASLAANVPALTQAQCVVVDTYSTAHKTYTLTVLAKAQQRLSVGGLKASLAEPHIGAAAAAKLLKQGLLFHAQQMVRARTVRNEPLVGNVSQPTRCAPSRQS